jgi:hypothetical protein
VPAGDVVLKIQWPHRESDHEADALELWHGDGAVQLQARDDEGRERVLGWTLGQTIAWSFDSDFHAAHAETARWLLEAAT